MKTRYGYACMNMSLLPKIRTNRGCVLSTFKREGLAIAAAHAVDNLHDLLQVIRWNKEHGVQVFRLPSNLLPWHTEYQLEELPLWNLIEAALKLIGREAKLSKQRLSFHPGPYNVLSSPKPEVVDAAIHDLTTYGKLFDIMGMPRDQRAKINIHIGGSFGNKKLALYRFCKAASRLPLPTLQRLTIENDDRRNLYSVRDLLTVHRDLGIPIVFDSHHWRLGPQDQPYEEALQAAVETWGRIRPCCHHSNGETRAHSEWYTSPFDDCGYEVDVILESKMKDLALLKYREDFLCK